ncbi:hypothetical protein [Lentzea sp. NPDC055074]
MTSTSPDEPVPASPAGDLLVHFADAGIRVRTPLIEVWRREFDVCVETVGADSEAVYRQATHEVRVRAGGRETLAQVGGGTSRVQVLGDVDARVTSAGHAEVRCGATTFALAPDVGRTVISGAAGRAEVSPAGFDVWCVESGWRVTASASLVVLEPVGGAATAVVWDSRTGALQVVPCRHSTLSAAGGPAAAEPCAGCGAVLDATWTGGVLEIAFPGIRVWWSDGVLEAVADLGRLRVICRQDVRVLWDGKDFVVKEDRVRVGAVDEDWYVTPDGRVMTGASTVTAARTVDGILEVSVSPFEDEGTALLWADGVCLEDRSGLRTVLDTWGGMVCGPVSRADHAVTALANGVVRVAVGSATVELAGAETVRL